MRKLLIFAFLAGLATGQEQPLVRVSTHLVEVNVVVRNKNGPVTGLTKDDFTLLENGKPRKIEVFNEVEFKPTTGRGPVQDASARGGSTVTNVYSNLPEKTTDAPSSATVVLYDRLNTAFPDQAYARKHVLAFLKSLDAHEQIALYVLGNGLKVLQDFTGDRERLTRALTRESPGQPATLEASEPDPDASDLINQMTENMQEFYMRNRVQTTLAGIEAIAQHLSRLPGRKNLVWISGSFPFSIGNGLHQTNFGEAMQRAARIVNNANIAVYPVDARGLMVTPGFSAASRGAPGVGMSRIPSGQDTMRLLADWTGGRAFMNTNDIRGAIQTALNDSEVTYTLGFYPDTDTLDGKYHEIKVKVDKGGMDVRSRKGYLAAEQAQLTAGQAQAAIREILRSPLEATGVGLKVRIDPSSAPGSYQLQVTIDSKNLLLEHKDERWSGRADVGFFQVARDGTQLDATVQNLDLNLKDQTYQNVQENGLTLSKTLAIKNGLDYIRVMVVDRMSGEVGSVRVPLPGS